jgi:hypothetical protein
MLGCLSMRGWSSAGNMISPLINAINFGIGAAPPPAGQRDPVTVHRPARLADVALVLLLTVVCGSRCGRSAADPDGVPRPQPLRGGRRRAGVDRGAPPGSVAA